MKKYIFLDIDGVLNSTKWFDCGRTQDYPNSEIDPSAVLLLNGIINNTGAEVVLSSSWRIGSTPQKIEKLLVSKGFEHKILDFTPRLHFKEDGGTVPRGCEIHQWLNDMCGCEYTQNVRYIILDDDSDMLLSQQHNFFKTDRACGLSLDLSYRAIRFLNRV